MAVDILVMQAMMLPTPPTVAPPLLHVISPDLVISISMELVQLMCWPQVIFFEYDTIFYQPAHDEQVKE